jgi:rfaE bifunctional protein kinase chain/domain
MGSAFLELLEKDNISTEGIIKSASRITTAKFRVIGNKVQLLRFDEEMDTNLNPEEESLLLKRLKELIGNQPIDVIIMQDYNKGVLSEKVIDEVIQLSKQTGIPVVVDPKKRNFNCYRDIDLFKPNLKELREGLKLDVDANSIEALSLACAQWQEKQNITSLMVTLSENGIFMREKTNGTAGHWHLPAHVRHISDVSGAGDTVISVASLCRALKADTELTIALANIAGGMVCEYIGVVPVNGNQLLEEAKQLLK